MSTHMKRVLTALITIPPLIGIICFAPLSVLDLLIMVVALASLHEFYRMIRPPVQKGLMFITYLLSVSLFSSLIFRDRLYIAILPFFVMIPLAYILFRSGRDNPMKGDNVGLTIVGPFYVCLPLMLLVLIARLPEGKLWIFYLLSVVFAGDTASFYAGRRFGKHGLIHVSPGKTWEGTVGGLLASTAIGGIFGSLFFPSLSLASIMVLATSIGISGQIGDLVESLFKRRSDVKDSGTLLPGHGGLLDRIDGLLFATPVLYLYLGFRLLL
jgi:phosphatidate cytidylyltransferase